jgi:hypothetical protein
VRRQVGGGAARRRGLEAREALRRETALRVEERRSQWGPPLRKPECALYDRGMDFDDTAGRLWKRLSREERLAAATRFFEQPSQEILGSALGAIIKARHLRPQVARSMPPEEQARALGSVLDPGEPVAAALLVALHLGERRAMLTTFLDALGLPHEDGILKEEADAVVLDQARLQTGLTALGARFGAHEIRTYLNTLWLQDPDRWDPLRALPEPA